MAEPVRSGTDAWIDEADETANHSGGNAIRLQAGARKGLVHQPLSDIRGRTVLSGTLTLVAKGANVAQTITVRMIADGWSASAVTWGNQPGTVPGVSCTVTIDALTDGDTATIDIVAILQQISNGKKARGLVLSTDAAGVGDSDWYSFDSGHDSWVTTYELSDAPEQPTDLRPDDGAVGTGKPVLSWSYADLGGDSSEQGAFRVQIDPGADGDSPAWELFSDDDADVDGSDPQCDLSVTDYPGLDQGDDTQWRVRTQDTTGNWSKWSNWAQWSHRNQPDLIMDSPTGGHIGDPTPAVLAHLEYGTMRRYRIRVCKGTDRTQVLYDTGRRKPDAGNVAFTIPWRDDDGKRIIHHDDRAFWINVRAWDTIQRADTVGRPSYSEQWVQVTFEQGLNQRPTDYDVAPANEGDIRLTHTWFRNEAADAWLIMHGTHIVHRLAADDVTADAGTYSFTDQGETQPYRPTTYTVRAIDAGSRSAASDPVTRQTKPEGLWIVFEDGGRPIHIRIEDDAVPEGFTTTDRGATFQLLNVPDDVFIAYGFEGVRLPVHGYIDSDNLTTADDVLAAVDRLESLRTDLTARPRLIWASRSIRAQVRDMSALPAGTFLDINRRHLVTFNALEVPD